MKRLKHKTVAIIICSVLLISNLFAINISADNTPREPCVKDHFNSLITTGEIIRTPPSEMSCSYAALSMLLSFYDAYWHDDFVPEQYEWDNGIYDPSTDTLIETFNAKTETKKWHDFIKEKKGTYRDFVNSIYDQYLESYLISVAKEIDLCDDDDEVFGLTTLEIVEFLEYYLYDKCLFSEDEVVIHLERAVDINKSDETLFETMKQQISNGFPLIYSGYSFDGADLGDFDLFQGISNAVGGHALIAFDTIGNEDNITDIKLHTGWITDQYKTVNTTEFKHWNTLIWLEIDMERLPHECSFKYTDSVSENITYCSCQVYPTHPAHSIHTYHGYEYNDLETHCYKCDCGFITNIQHHNVTYSYHSPIQHYEICSICEYQTARDHTYTPMSYVSPEGHQSSCICGAVNSNLDAHYAHSYTRKNASHHYVYCECGYLIEERPHSWIIGMMNNVCRHCGYMSSGPVMKDELPSGDEEHQVE